jgi:protein-tyrosine-phosphatase
MAERGFDISAKRTKHLDRFAGAHFDWVISLCDKVREVCPEFPDDPHRVHWSIADPATAGATDDETYPAFQQTAAELEERIGQLLARLSPPEGGTTHAR